MSAATERTRDAVTDPPMSEAQSPDGPAPDLTVDSLGRRCPLPIIDLAKRIGEVPVGGTVELLADDPAAAPDVSAWCRLRGHELLATRDFPAGQAFLVRRTG